MSLHIVFIKNFKWMFFVCAHPLHIWTVQICRQLIQTQKHYWAGVKSSKKKQQNFDMYNLYNSIQYCFNTTQNRNILFQFFANWTFSKTISYFFLIAAIRETSSTFFKLFIKLKGFDKLHRNMSATTLDCFMTCFFIEKKNSSTVWRKKKCKIFFS